MMLLIYHYYDTEVAVDADASDAIPADATVGDSDAAQPPAMAAAAPPARGPAPRGAHPARCAGHYLPLCGDKGNTSLAVEWVSCAGMLAETNVRTALQSKVKGLAWFWTAV